MFINIEDYEYIATERKNSLFQPDIDNAKEILFHGIKGKRIAVVGAAGSIGASIVETILKYEPAGLYLFDLNENGLVELVRKLRSDYSIHLPDDFICLPIGMGSKEFEMFFEQAQKCSLFFNLAAIKHVRSEKSIFSIIRMIDTNVLFLYDFLKQISYSFEKVFSVSSDKAAAPANIMGATKYVMELALSANSGKHKFSTARFANVAFSNGSLLYGFLMRIAYKQPLSAPLDIKRFFISHKEAAHLCVLSCVCGENGDLFFPKLEKGKNEKKFSDIAVLLLRKLGYEPILCSSEEEAKLKCKELIPQKKWPCYFFTSDTSGEKPFEEFYLPDENIVWNIFENIGVIKRNLDLPSEFTEFINFARNLKTNKNITKQEIILQLKNIVPGFLHMETGKNLDSKM